MSKSKEEILGHPENLPKDNLPDYLRTVYLPKKVLSAMEEYRDQEVKSNATALVNLVYETLGFNEFINQETTVGEIRDAIVLKVKLQAIVFAEWMDGNGYTRMFNGGWQSLSDFSNKSTDELYDIFTTHQSQQK